MIKEYKEHIQKYSLEGYGWFSKLISKSKWGDINSANEYLEKYWLSEKEYTTKWKNIQGNIFSSLDTTPPDIVYTRNFELLILQGGCLFLEDDFQRLQECLLEIGEKFLVIVENTFGSKLIEPAFRMRYPSDITWKEITSGNFISSSIIENPNKEFFVFGELGSWGKYSASDYTWPIDLIGFKTELNQIFNASFIQSKEEKQRIKNHIPPSYLPFVGSSKTSS